MSKKELRLSALEMEKLGISLVFPQYRDAEAEANSRRVVACLNACAGISTENLEDNLPVKELADRYNALQKHCDGFAEQAAFQRDARLGALKELAIVERQRDELLKQRDELLATLKGAYKYIEYLKYGTAADEYPIIYQRTISTNDHPEWETHFMPRHYRYIVNVINGLIAFGECDEISIQFGRREDVTAMHIFEPFSTLNYLGFMSPSVVSLCFESSTSNVSFYSGDDNGIGIFCDSLKHETTLPLPKNCMPDIDFWHFVDSIGHEWGSNGYEGDYIKEYRFSTPRF